MRVPYLVLLKCQALGYGHACPTRPNTGCKSLCCNLQPELRASSSDACFLVTRAFSLLEKWPAYRRQAGEARKVLEIC